MSENTQIYSATYSNVPVFEFVTSEGPIMRRKGDSWINATHILKIAKLPKAKRTRILEKDVQTGVHEKVQGGYGKYQGTYVPLKLGEVIARNYDVYNTLKPIFDFEYIEGKTETPPPAPKHNHASALNVAKRQASLQKKDLQLKQPKQPKAKRTGDEPRKRGRPKGSTLSSTPSLQHSDTVPLGSVGYSRENSFAAPIPRMSRQNTEQDALHMMASNMNLRQEDLAPVDTDEDDDDHYGKNGGAGLKRSKKNNGNSMHNGDFDTNTDLLTSRELFGVSRNTFEKNAHNFNAPQADLITPYHQPSINLSQDNQIYSDYFTNFVSFFLDDEGNKGQLNAPAESVLPEKLLNPPQPVSKIHINHPIDNEGNTIFHWLCSLGYLTLIKFLIEKFGKEIRIDVRNNNGETPLMFMVKFSNCFSSGTFEEVLGVLFESLILVDSSGKTVLHHIAEYKKEKVAAYYLEVLLKRLVNEGKEDNSLGEANVTEEKFELITKFINHQDSDGNTAFHIAAYNLNKKLIKVFIDYHKFINFSLRNLVTCTVEDYLASHNYVLRLDAASDGEDNSNVESAELISNNRHDMVEEVDSLGQSFDAQLYNSKLAINLYNNTANILTEKMAELSYIINQELKEKDETVLNYFKTLSRINEIKLSIQRAILSIFKLEHLIDDLDEGPKKETRDPSSQESNVLETNYDNFQVNFKRDQIIQEEIQRLVNDLTYQLLHRQEDLSHVLQKFTNFKEFLIKRKLETLPSEQDADTSEDPFELAKLLQMEILKKKHLLSSVVDYSKNVPILANGTDTSKPIIEQFAPDSNNKLIKYCKLISLSCGMRFDEIESNIDMIEQSLLKNR